MKVKLFEYTRRWEKEDFEKEINDFTAGVEVIDVKYTEATSGDYENLDTITALLVLYK